MVNGKWLTGSRVAMVPAEWFSMGRAGDLLKKYAAGKQLAVFHDPANPTLCTLMNGLPTSTRTFFAIAGTFGIFAVSMVLEALMLLLDWLLELG